MEVGRAEHGEVVPPEQFNAWPEADRKAAEAAIHDLEHDLEQTLRYVPRLDKERRDAVRELDHETARFAIGQSMEDARAQLVDLPGVPEHLDAVLADLVQNVQLFVAQPAGPEEQGGRSGVPNAAFDRYEVNVLVTDADGVVDEVVRAALVAPTGWLA